MKFIPQIDYIDISRKDEIELFISEWYSEESTITTRTSGSTGEPKTIALSKPHLLISAKKTIAFLQIEKGSSCYLCLSCSTIAGKMMMVRAILNEMRIIVGPVSSGSLELLNEKVAFTAIVPMQLQQTLLHLPEKLRLIDKTIVGGAPINTSIEDLLKLERLTVYQTFGMTETISHVALRKIGFQQEKYYHALDGITFSISKQQCLVIHYPEIDLDELLTNDLVELQSPTTFKWLGRADFVINSGGIKLFPEVIESKLSQHINRSFFIYGLQDEKLGQKVVLLIEGEAFAFEKEIFHDTLEKYEKPREIIFLTQFIRTESGKINRLETIKLLSA